ncbi:MAG: M13 family metallopeptidase [Terracidiphilus sp.]|jgi:endothelin-converting enzyme/putative endopeptidase
MIRRLPCFAFALLLPVALYAQAPAAPALPYSPSLDLTSMDKSVDPCVDFYTYSCGGWQKKNPIPPDQTSWSVYAKLYQDNLMFLRGILEDAAAGKGERTQVTQEIGDFYGACMNEPAVNQRGVAAIQPQLDSIAALKSVRDIAPLVATLTLPFGETLLFEAGSTQDPDDSEREIADLGQGGLGLPDRDYYTNDDAKSKEIRQKYVEHVQKVFALLGDSPDVAAKNAQTVMRMETALAKASWTGVERRDPYNLKDKLDMAGLEKLAPGLDWPDYYRVALYPHFDVVNVESPKFLQEASHLLTSEPLDNWKTYFRFHVADAYSPFLSQPFDDENFSFYRAYLRGAKEQQPRWRRCVQHTDYNLGEALGQAYVARVFSPELKAQTLEMVDLIEAAMRQRIDKLDWMSPETKKQALIKLAGIRNKIGYPDKWRDYSSIKLTQDDFAGDIERTGSFELHRQINKIGKPVDHGEWGMSAATVDAYFDPQMNDINFPAGVLQPPVYDTKMDDAPNYGDTGGTIGHELTHGFDDEGSQFDAKGNLKNWWTKEDREKFDARTKCVADQYSSYIATDAVHVNGKLTLGENVADLGGEILGFIAWQAKTKGMNLQPIDGLTPEQRFFVGFAQWDCANERPDDLRERAITDPHSPAKYRINGVVVNMPEFGKAFGCKPGQPMMRPADQVCRVW